VEAVAGEQGETEAKQFRFRAPGRAPWGGVCPGRSTTRGSSPRREGFEPFMVNPDPTWLALGRLLHSLDKVRSSGVT